MLDAVSWSWVDVGFVLFLLLSVSVGLWRGVVFELMSLLGWVVAFIAAQTLQAWAQPLVPFGQPGTGLNRGLAFAAVFLATLVVWGLGRFWAVARHAGVVGVGGGYRTHTRSKINSMEPVASGHVDQGGCRTTQALAALNNLVSVMHAAP
jgi:hypothetical protein